MNPAVYIAIFMSLMVVIMQMEQTNAQMATIQIIRRKFRRKGLNHMNESVKQFIGKSCMVYTYNAQMTGTAVSVEDNWLTLETKTGTELVNLDYISRIREYPRGKKKDAVSE